MSPLVSVQILYLFAILLCLGKGVTSRRNFFNPKAVEQDLFEGRAANTTFDCPGTGNYPIPGKECTGDYYSCATNTPIPEVCAGSSIFEPSTLVCTSSFTAPCKQTTLSTTMTTDSTFESVTDLTTKQQISTTTAVSTRQTTTQTVKPSDVPFVCQDNGAFPNPSNCNTFYMCSNGIAYLYLCPSNLVFNPATSNCDYASNVSGPCLAAR